MSRRFRSVWNKLMLGLCTLAFLIALVPLVSLFTLVIGRGLRGFSWSFLTELPAPVGEQGGGVANAIVGTAYLVGMATLVAVPIGIGAGVLLAERPSSRLSRAVRFTAEVLSGVPSIVVGIVAYGIIVVRAGHFGAAAGSTALAILMVPPLARTTEEIVRLVPGTLREAGLALGVPGWRVSLGVIIPTALGGIITGVLLAISRAAGETAPLLFTALNNQYWNFSPAQPTASLPVQIFNYAISPYEAWHAKAWTSALVLLVLVALLNVSARLLHRRSVVRRRL